MAEIDEIVSVTVTAETEVPSREGFGTPLIMAYHTVFPERYRIYNTAADMLSDGFTSSDLAYLAANAMFSQSPRPPRVVIGREENTQKQKIKITPVTANLRANYDYKVYVNGQEAKYTTDATPIVSEITAGLKTAIDTLALDVTTTDNTTDLDIESDTVADQFQFWVGDRTLISQANITPDLGGADGIVDDISAVQAEYNDWYALTVTMPSKAIISAAAAYIQGLTKLFLAASGDDEILNPAVTDDIASATKTAGYSRTAIEHHTKPLTQYLGAAWQGRCLPKDPGTITWMHMPLTGPDTVTYTATERATMRSKNCNFYSETARIGTTKDGITAKGGATFIDVTRSTDYIASDSKLRIFTKLANADKISYTDKGTAVVQGELAAALQSYVDNNIFAEVPAPTTSVPLVADVSIIDKGNRLLPDVKGSGILAGAIHTVQVDITVSI